ncbi:MAG: thermosome subunit beta [Nanoarchaeota archaeon]
MNKQQVQPIFILPEDTRRTTGKDAQRMNIMAAKLVAETVRTTLGPKGMDKMIVDSLGDVTVTNDGVTILEEMNIEHPSAKMVVEIAKTQENEVGDGTTTAVVLAGELLKKAEDLLDQEIHPTVIAKGYRMAQEKAQEVLNSMAMKIQFSDKELLRKVAITAMTGKGAETAKDLLSDIIVKAIQQVAEVNGDKVRVDIDNVKIEKKVGGRVEDTELIEGIVLDKEKLHPGMPTQVKEARIALLDCPLEIKNPEIDAKISITDPEKMQAFIDMEERMLKNIVEKIAATGANVVFCQKGVDDLVQHFLAKRGIFGARRIKRSDMEKLAKATGGSMVNNLEDLSASDLGQAGIVEELKFGEEAMTYVRDCKKAKAVTILIRGSTSQVVDEVKRAMEDSLGDLAAALKNNLVVGGAGAPEMEVAKHLRQYANTLSGREQLAAKAFADAMEVIPRTLAENAGLDTIDMLAELKSAHERGEKWAGVNVFTGKIMDAWAEGVIEPLKIKTQALSSASEVAIMILRIDDVIAGGKASEAPGMPEGHHD